MSRIFGELSVETFLARYWQKRPLLVRGAFDRDFPSFDEHDLAGLACESFAESRLVQGQFPKNNWQLEHGPFEESRFSELPESGWTLLVQDVEKHYPPLRAFMSHFDFLPSWRLDDLMISFAATGGSAGPHVDQYDVFLVQASGSKRWQISESFSPERLADCPLDVLKTFSPEQAWDVHAGDMLYLPPNIAHHGVALDDGMTWSVGLRAPAAADLFSAMAEHVARLPGGGPRYTDPPLSASIRSGELDSRSARRAIDMLRDVLEDEAGFTTFMAQQLSHFGVAQEPVNPGPDLSPPELRNRIQQGQTLVTNPWTRMTWIESDSMAKLFAVGMCVRCSIELAVNLCNLDRPEVDPKFISAADHEALCKLVNAGHLVFSDA
ncbi:MAG: cupin domain-containing protein [Xanthomonadales bacterium]|nr:cupin domain-containing protein [Xanthomonadales bacterium]